MGSEPAKIADALPSAHEVRAGSTRRSAQEILGHSDAILTAQAFTDVASVQLHDEIAKLPWISSGVAVARGLAQKTGVSGPSLSLADICSQLIEGVKVTDAQSVSHALASSVTSLHSSEMAARVGE